jgi:hypothetical protein
VRRTIPRGRHVLTHLTAAVVVPGCIVLCWWQVTRALGGNTLSWAYVFEWPVFAGYGVFMWWKLIHAPPAEDRSGAPDPSIGAVTSTDATRTDPEVDSDAGNDCGTGPAEDDELASYNRYLAALNASGRRKHW